MECLGRLKSLGCKVITVYDPHSFLPMWRVLTPGKETRFFKTDDSSMARMAELCEQLDIPRRRAERIESVIG